MAQKVGNVEFYSGPDDLEKIIVDFIKGAQKRLEIAVQELESRSIAEAIIDARKRKVIVKVVLEQDYLRASRTRHDPWLAGGGKEEDREIQNALFRSNIDSLVKTRFEEVPAI